MVKNNVFLFILSLLICPIDFKTFDISLTIIIFQLALFFIPSFLIIGIGYYKERKEGRKK